MFEKHVTEPPDFQERRRSGATAADSWRSGAEQLIAASQSDDSQGKGEFG